MDDSEYIDSYTRVQAIADGVLIDVSELAKEAGFNYPVALTSAVHQRYVTAPAEMEEMSETGRLCDILTVLRYTAKNSPEKSEILSDFPFTATASDWRLPH
jgi:hypothetical protein